MQSHERMAQEARQIFAQRLAQARMRLFSDQDTAGAAFGLRKGRWGGYERARCEPPLWVIRLLPEKLHMPLAWFFGLPDERGLDDKETEIVSMLRAIPDPRRRAHATELVITVLESFRGPEGTVARPANAPPPGQ